MVFPPLTRETTAGGAKSGAPILLAYMWPSRWFTPTSGLSAAQAAPLANATPTTRAPTRPGAYVTPTPSRSDQVRRSMPKRCAATSRHSSHTPQMASMCLRLAISGTTPPKREWKSIWLATTSESRLPFPSTMAAAVSSHELSMARMSGRSRCAAGWAAFCASCASSTRSVMPATSTGDSWMPASSVTARSAFASAAPPTAEDPMTPCSGPSMITASSRSE